MKHIHFLTPVQLLEKQKLDLEQYKINFEKEKLEYNLLLNIINNDKYTNTVSEILQDKLPSLLENIKNNQIARYQQIAKSSDMELCKKT